ncbi:MAG: hypothetical protein GY798_23245 [Hyphomicrobiales bacterium]|nr:hypothetical protein [Hyphomicrobiales bacterium]
METIIWKVVQVVLPIYATVALGVLLGRLKVPWDSKSFGRLVLNVGFTSLVVAKLGSAHVASAELLQILWAGALAFLAFLVLSYGIIRLLSLPLREYWAAFSLSNMSIGMALGLYAFGQKGLALALGFTGIMLIAQFTAGMWIPSGRISLGQAARTPFFYALALGLILTFTGTALPTSILDTFELIGGLAIPLALLILGVSLADVDLGTVGKSLGYAAIHLAMIAVVGVGLAFMLGLQGDFGAMFILLCLMPSSTLNLIMAQQAGIKTANVSSFIMASNLLVVVSLPIALGFLLI